MGTAFRHAAHFALHLLHEELGSVSATWAATERVSAFTHPETMVVRVAAIFFFAATAVATAAAPVRIAFAPIPAFV